MKISVVVPVYKQERTIEEDIAAIGKALAGIAQPSEIVVVVDGSPDKTFEKIRPHSSETVKVFSYEKNKGKGYALRYGAARSDGEIVVFLDSGMDINPEGISMLFEHMKWYRADIIIGSKRHPASKVDYPFIRKVTSSVYQLLVFFLFGLRVHDTQTGLKMFRREVLEKVLPRLLVKQYAIDVEILAIAFHLGFRRIYEAPVDVKYQFDDLTHASTIGNIWRMIKDTLAVFYRLRIKHYYDDENQRYWRLDSELGMGASLV